MTNAGKLLFGTVPSFPVLWVLGLLGFIALWWYTYRGLRALRRLFLALWLPAALAAGLVYKLEGQGIAVVGTLRLIAQRDPATLRLLFAMPGDAYTATYAVAVGGAVAALATMTLQLAGLLLTI